MESTGNLLLEISRFTAQAFVSGLWQGLLLIAVAALCLRLLSRVSASARFAVWGLVFALVIAIPLLHPEIIAARQPYAPPGAIHLGGGWSLAISGIWATLTLLRASQLWMQAARLHRIWHNARPAVADPETLALLRDRGRSAQLCSSADVDSPCVIGFFSPRLLIPERLHPTLAETDLRQIVLHECEHLRREDDWINLLQKIGMALFPLNPALLWVDRRLSLERELACDAGVVASTGAPFDYARCLTRLAEHRLFGRSVGLSLSAWSRQPELTQRVLRLLRPMREMSSFHAKAVIALLGLGLAAGAGEMARAPRLVSFDFDNVAAAPVSQAAAATTPAPVATQVASLQAPQPRAIFLHADLPSGAYRIPQQRKQTAKPDSQLHNIHARKSPVRPQLLLSTAMQPVRAIGSRPTRNAIRANYVDSPDFVPSYAAVPFADGWLIIQL